MGFIGEVYAHDYDTVKGDYQYGDVEDLEVWDSDDMLWDGESIGLSYVIEVELDFERKSNIGTDNWFQLKFSYDGTSTLIIIVRYYGGSSDTFYESSTTGYEVISPALDDYKSVIEIEFQSTQLNVEQELYLRYLVVLYGVEE